MKKIIFLLVPIFFLASFAFWVFLPHRQPVPEDWWNEQKTIDLRGLQFKSAVLANNLTLHYVEAGARGDTPVMLLHGFPETALLSWYPVLGALAQRGFHVIAPDQRGYNLSSKPPAASDYRTELLMDDVLLLADAVGWSSSFSLVGHDWGGLLTWGLATTAPERIERAAVLNIAHPAVFERRLSSHLSQVAKSWYAIFFQLPLIPELKLSLFDFSFLLRAFWSSSIRGVTFAKSAIPLYRQAWAVPGALTAMINWYRASLRSNTAHIWAARPRAPVLLLFGLQDIAQDAEMFDESRPYATEAVAFPNGTHWLQQEHAEEVVERVAVFLKN